MFFSIATTHQPATDLGYLLAKHPDRLHEVELAFGRAHVVFPEATETSCEAALILDVDPVGLVRGRGDGDGLLDQYVNDRPYAASSFLSVALVRAFRTAMTGSLEGAARSRRHGHPAGDRRHAGARAPLRGAGRQAVRAARLASRGGAARRALRPLALRHHPPRRRRARRRRARPRLRAAPRARRREALLGRRRRGGEAGRQGRDLAAGPPRARPHRQAVPERPARLGPRGAGAADPGRGAGGGRGDGGGTRA